VLTTVSDDIPERGEMIRSSVITVIFTAVFTIIALVLWAWESLPEDEISPLDALNDLNPYVTLLIEALVMLGFFIFLCVTVINLRMFFSDVRAGWLEVIASYILVVAMAWLMFGSAVGGVSAILCLGFVVYLYLLQD
jgi:magnesium-transporting ATPase (P-type)